MGIVSQAMRQRYLLSSCIVFVVVVYGDDSWHPLLSDVSIWCNTYTITIRISYIDDSSYPTQIIIPIIQLFIYPFFFNYILVEGW